MEKWESIYLKTQLYHSWAYTQKTYLKDTCSAIVIADQWMEIEKLILSEITQAQEDNDSMYSLTSRY